MNEKILVIGTQGPATATIVQALQARYGETAVITADHQPGAAIQLDVRDKLVLQTEVLQHRITAICFLPQPEKLPLKNWEFQLQGLLNILEVAKTDQLKIYRSGRELSRPPKTVAEI